MADTSRAQIFEQMYRKHYLRLFRYALSWIENEEEAKDIVSQLFSDLWDSQTVISEQTVTAYLNRSVRNRCVNYLRHLQVEQRAVDEMIASKDFLFGETPDELEKRMRKVDEVLSGMNEKVRFAVEQHYLEGKKYSEVAQMMDTTTGMVHKYISKALGIFRDAFGKELSHEGYRMLLSLVLPI